MSRSRRIFAQFDGQEILLEQGRLLFSLLNAFSLSGYTIALRDRFAAALGKYGKLALNLPGVSLVKQLPLDPEAWILICDRKGADCASRRWRREFDVKFDLFSPYRVSTPIIMPFPLHPLQARIDDEQLSKLRAAKRQMKVFFSGDSKGYVRNWVTYPKPKLPRLEILRLVMNEMASDVAILPDASLLHGPEGERFEDKCVIADPQRCWIDAEQWLPTLAISDFFLCPPGIVMPMCHNIVEAMAVGTIPITNYPEWFSPRLRHLENCIVFDDREDLIAKMRLGMAMPASEVARIKLNVLDYFDREMRPQRFVRRIEERPSDKLTLLMYAEANMSANSQRMGRSSLLFADRLAPDRALPMKFLQFLLPRRWRA